MVSAFPAGPRSGGRSGGLIVGIISASYVTMSPAGAHTRGRKGNWNANRELRASGWEQRIFASTIERLERMGQGCRKEKAGNSESRTESAGEPLGGQRETKTVP